MKKNILAITALVSVMMLSGCGTNADNETAQENIDYTDGTVSESVTVSESAEETVQTDNTVSVTETETETELTETVDETYIETEDETVRYLEVGLSNEKTVYSIDDFADKQAIETAAELIKETEKYKSGLAEAEELKDIVIDNGREFTFEPVFVEGITDDFDGDGKEESFFMMMPDFITGEGGLIWINSYVFFEDSDGNVSMLPESFHSCSSEYDPERNGADEPIFTEIEYDGFSHVLIRMGFNNITAAAYIYSVNDGMPKFETCQKRIFETVDNIGLLCGAPQIPHNWIAVWDNVDKCYVTPEAVELSEDEKAEFIADPAVAQILDDTFKDEPNIKAVVIGGKYYSFGNNQMTRTFVRSDNGFEFLDNSINFGNLCSCKPEEFTGDEALNIEMPVAKDIILG